MNLSTLIRNRRKELNLTSTEVAESLGISQATYCHYEKSDAKIPSSMIEPLSNILKLTSSTLFELCSLNSLINKAETALNSYESDAEAEIRVENLAEILGYYLIKDYSTSKDNKNISAFIRNDKITLITEKEYDAIINSIKDFAFYKLNAMSEAKQNN